MSDVLVTPLMGLSNPVPGSDPGPDYATNLYNSLNIIDQHNHSAGSGNQVGTSGIIINADLPFNTSYNATLVRSVRFAAQLTPLALATDLGCLYRSGVDLYYNDGSGNQVRMTSGGNVNATSSGISSGTATASFVGSTLVVNSNTNTPADIQCGSVKIGEVAVSPNFVTVSSPTSLAASYSFILPTALPGARSFMTLDSSGNVATGVAYTGGLTTTNLSATAGILRSQMVALGQQISSSCGSFSGSATSATDITNMTITITTSGRPVRVFCQPATTNASCFMSTSGGNSVADVRLVRGATDVGSVQTPGLGGTAIVWPPSAIEFLDAPVAGTYAYKLQYGVSTGAVSFQMFNMVLVAYEL